MSPSVKFKRNTRTLAGIKGDRESLKINPDFIQRTTQLKHVQKISIINFTRQTSTISMTEKNKNLNHIYGL